MSNDDVTEADTAIVQILSWLAVQSDDATAIARTLGIVDLRPCPVEQGLYESHPHFVDPPPDRTREQTWWSRLWAGRRRPAVAPAKCFIAPPIEGWTLLFYAPDDGDIALDDDLRAELSRVFGEAQAFYSDAKHYFYRWARSRDGKTVRVVDGAGLGGEDEIRSEGDSTPPEPNDLRKADEYDMIRIARAWSVDPNKLLNVGVPGQIGTRPKRGSRTGV